jgi:hypothetical protein
MRESELKGWRVSPSPELQISYWEEEFCLYLEKEEDLELDTKYRYPLQLLQYYSLLIIDYNSLKAKLNLFLEILS